MNEEMRQLFWYWVTERHQIYLKRQAGDPKPWTQDIVLQEYFFCNVYRELDPGTVWLRENYIKPHANDGGDLLFNIVKYRMFNLESTAALLGYQKNWDKQKVIATLTKAAQYGPIYTCAYMTRGFTGLPKHVSHCRVLTNVWKNRDHFAYLAQEYRNLQMMTGILSQEIPSVGPFTAYEMVTDLRHTPILSDAEDIMTWANPGPGAKRGILRLCPEARKSDYLPIMQELLRQSELEIPISYPKMEMRDIEHSLCEVDRYCRARENRRGLRRYRGR